MAEIETTTVASSRKPTKAIFTFATASSSTVIVRKPTNKISPRSRNTTLKSLPMPMRTWRNTTELPKANSY